MLTKEVLHAELAVGNIVRRVLHMIREESRAVSPPFPSPFSRPLKGPSLISSLSCQLSSVDTVSNRWRAWRRP